MRRYLKEDKEIELRGKKSERQIIKYPDYNLPTVTL